MNPTFTCHPFLRFLTRTRLFRQVSPERHQQIIEGSQPAAKIRVPERAEELEEAGRSGFFCVGLHQRRGNCAGEVAEQRRLDLSEGLDEQEQVAGCANGVRSSCHLDHLLEDRSASAQRGTQNLEHAAIMEALQHLVRGQHGLSVLPGRLLKSRLELPLGIPWRKLQRNRSSHACSYVACRAWICTS